MGFSTWGNLTNQTVRLSGHDLEIAEPRQSHQIVPCIWRVSDSSLPEHAPNTVSLSPGRKPQTQTGGMSTNFSVGQPRPARLFSDPLDGLAM